MFIKMFAVKPDDLSYGGKRIDSYKFSSDLYTCGGIYMPTYKMNISLKHWKTLLTIIHIMKIMSPFLCSITNIESN